MRLLAPFGLQPIAPKIASKLGSSALPAVTNDAFFAVLRALSFLGPKLVSPAAGQAVVRRNYVELVKAAAAFWHVAGDSRAANRREWYRKQGRFGMA